jgi:hypothetical protein
LGKKQEKEGWASLAIPANCVYQENKRDSLQGPVQAVE